MYARKAIFSASIKLSDPGVKKVVETILFREPSLLDELASNAHLSEATWLQFYNKPNFRVDRANALCSRLLSNAQRLAVIKKEKRTEPVLQMIYNNQLEAEEIELLLQSPALKPKGILAILSQIGDSQPHLRRELSLRVGGVSQFSWLASGVDVDADSARLMLGTCHSWAGNVDFQQRNIYLQQILERFPEIIDAYVAPQAMPALRTVAAGSRFLTSLELQRAAAGLKPEGFKLDKDSFYSLIALINNPVVGFGLLEELLEALKSLPSTSSNASATNLINALKARQKAGRDGIKVPYAEVSDKVTLDWLLKRTLPSPYKVQGRPFDLAQLILNPNLSAKDRNNAISRISLWSHAEFLGVFYEPLKTSFKELYPEAPALPDFRAAASRPTFWDTTPSRRNNVFTKEYLDDIKVDDWSWMDAYFWEELGTYLTASFGDSSSKWETFLALLEGHEGSLGNLVEVSKAL